MLRLLPPGATSDVDMLARPTMLISGCSLVGLPFPLPVLALRHREDSFETIDFTGKSSCALGVEMEDTDNVTVSEEHSLPPLIPVIHPWLLEVDCSP